MYIYLQYIHVYNMCCHDVADGNFLFVCASCDRNPNDHFLSGGAGASNISNEKKEEKKQQL